ncbi:MAG: peptidylprolyl isomerase [Clostridia bacterium]|nr:peptidylprolyl isomerase [Clostridia bacterium]
MAKKFALMTASLMIAAFLAGCGGASKPETVTEAPTETAAVSGTDTELLELMSNSIDAVITFTDGKTVELELYPDIAPKTVANFINYVNQGFYDGTIIHRVVDGFVIQGGGYDAELNRKEVSETVEGEFAENGTNNPLHHDRGVISMARIPSEPDSASTQFFIVVEDNRESLDGQYAAFGRVRSGMEVVDAIASKAKMKDPPAGLSDMPEEIYEIRSITIVESENTEAPAEEKTKKEDDAT